MKPDALDLLAIVAQFLEGAAANAVSQELRSEVRAAAKNLADARVQLDEAFPLLTRECEELAQAIDAARSALDESAHTEPDRQEPEKLSELHAQHEVLLAQLGDLLLRVQATKSDDARQAQASIFALLREQAGRRLSWQSVFPADRLVSDVLRGTWPQETGKS